jgi:hypothetical protein
MLVEHRLAGLGLAYAPRLLSESLDRVAQQQAVRNPPGGLLDDAGSRFPFLSAAKAP